MGRVHSILRTLLGLQMAIFSLGLLSVRCLCPNLLIASYLIRAPVLLDEGPTLTVSFNLNYLFKRAFLVAQMVKNLNAVPVTWV